MNYLMMIGGMVFLNVSDSMFDNNYLLQAIFELIDENYGEDNTKETINYIVNGQECFLSSVFFSLIDSPYYEYPKYCHAKKSFTYKSFLICVNNLLSHRADPTAKFKNKENIESLNEYKSEGVFPEGDDLKIGDDMIAFAKFIGFNIKKKVGQWMKTFLKFLGFNIHFQWEAILPQK